MIRDAGFGWWGKRSDQKRSKRSRIGFVSISSLAVCVLVPMCSVVSMGATGPNPATMQLTFTQFAASFGSTADIPPTVLQAYVSATGQADELHPGCVVRPAILAGIGWKETRHGTYGGSTVDAAGNVAPPIIGIPLNGQNNTARISDTDNGRLDGDTTWDRAVGPMQFIPSSWAIYGQDGNNDGVQDPQNIFDAALAAIDHLCNRSPVDMNASPEALRAALFGYNQSTSYVESVIERVAFYDTALVAGGDPSTLLAHPNFTACEAAVKDLETGQVDQRVISMLTMLTQTYSLYACPFKSGHYQCVGGGDLASRPNCSESHHWYGRAVDISLVNGKPVNNSNQAAREIVEFLATLNREDTLRPSGVGSPWAEYNALPGFFNDAAHEDHLHLGWCGPRWSRGSYGDSCL